MRTIIATFFLVFLLFPAFSQQKMVYGTFRRIHDFPKDLPYPKRDSILEFPIFIGDQYLVLKRFKRAEFIGEEGKSTSVTWEFQNGTIALTFLVNSQPVVVKYKIIRTKKNIYLQDSNSPFRNFKKT